MKTSLKIGRDNSNDVVINEPRISRNHAIITNTGNGTFEVKDLGSTNGTFVNGKRVQQEIIRQGDKLEVAGCLVNWYEAFLTSNANKEKSSIKEQPFSKIRKTISIGSDPQNDIVVPDNFVSGKHAQISLLKNNNYYIEDLSSSNGTFVNGSRILAKNFNKTDVVKIATIGLPVNWFQHKNIKPNYLKDNKNVLLISLSLIVLITGLSLCYINSCEWFGLGCNLTPQTFYSKNNNSIVHIEHSYYYTIQANGRKYFVGKNKTFGGIEANPGKENLDPYNTMTGSGCFIKSDGTILTSSSVASPWLNELEKYNMLGEVEKSKTIDNFSPKENYTICGESAGLKFLANGLVNNPQNYINATRTGNECSFTDFYTTIQSVKKNLPQNASVAKYYLNPNTKEMHNTSGYYYSAINALNDNSLMRDTFFFAKDSSNINKLIVMTLNKSLPVLQEGSAVFNERGELIGIINQQQVILLHHLLYQSNN